MAKKPTPTETPAKDAGAAPSHPWAKPDAAGADSAPVTGDKANAPAEGTTPQNPTPTAAPAPATGTAAADQAATHANELAAKVEGGELGDAAEDKAERERADLSEQLSSLTEDERAEFEEQMTATAKDMLTKLIRRRKAKELAVNLIAPDSHYGKKLQRNPRTDGGAGD